MECLVNAETVAVGDVMPLHLILLQKLADQLNNSSLTIKDIQNLIVENDAVIYEKIEKYISDISIGLNNVINFYNPETLVLNSEILKIIPNVIEKIQNHLSSAVSHYCKIVLSEFGNKACVMGACALAIQRFLRSQNLV